MNEFISTWPHTGFNWRRALLQTLGAALTLSAFPLLASAETRSYRVVVHRNRGCSCCEAWAATLMRTGRFHTTLVEEADLEAVRRGLGVPADLAGCHTTEAEGFVIEGHVPASDILRLLTERPAGIRGLAVRGMPIGSPGMDFPGAAREPFEVFAFRANGARSVFARYS